MRSGQPYRRRAASAIAPHFAIALLAAIAAAAAASCGGETAVETLVGPDGVRCQTTLGVPQAPVPPDGGPINVSVTAARDCTWTATSEASWMQLNATSGQGNATLGVTVARNDAGAARSGAIVVNNQRVTITQQPRPCTYELRASPQNIRSEGGRGTISITTLAGCAWTAASSATWLRVLTPSGTGDGPADFEAAANDGGPRQATVAIDSQTITITQDGANQPGSGGGGGNTCSISVAPSTVSAPAASGTHAVAVTAPSGCDWRTSSNAFWLTVAPPSGRGNGPVTITAARNTGSARTGTVTVNDLPITVNQAAAPACTATIDAASASFPAMGGEGKVRVTTTQDDCEWTATGGDPSWIQIATPRGTGTNDARYVVLPNTGTTARSTTLTIGGHSHSVTQEGLTPAPCTYTLTPGSHDFPAAGGTHTFSVATQAGCSWTAGNGGSQWVTITSTTANSVSYSVSQNSGAARQASISVSGGGGSASHNVTQQAQPPQTCTFNLSSSSQDFPAAGGPGTFTVTPQPAGCTWSASSNQGWARITSSSGSTVSYTVDSNSGGARQASITVSGGGGSASHTVTQQPMAQTCSYTLTPTSQDFPPAGGNHTFSVATQAGCTWTASNGGSNWITIGSTTPTSVSYSVPANSGAARQGSITVSGGGGSASHTVTQQPTHTCTYSLSSNSANFPANGGPGEFTVTTQANCNWSAQLPPNTSWVNISSGSGSGSQKVVYSVQNNQSTSSRSTAITVDNQSHSISQAGAAPTCTYQLQPGSQQVPSQGGTFTFSVVTQQGCAWTLSGGANWITNVTQSGNNVTYTVQTNTTGAQRQGSLTVNFSGGSQSHSVTQAQ